jgi:hypothetical protein
MTTEELSTPGQRLIHIYTFVCSLYTYTECEDAVDETTPNKQLDIVTELRASVGSNGYLE